MSVSDGCQDNRCPICLDEGTVADPDHSENFREVGPYIIGTPVQMPCPECARVDRLVREAVDAERKACASIADETRENCSYHGDFNDGIRSAGGDIAAAIRSRGVSEGGA